MYGGEGSADRTRIQPEDSFIRRLDPDYVALVKDVDDVKSRMVSLEKSNWRQERYLVGGFAEDGVTWMPGLRERVDKTLEQMDRIAIRLEKLISRDTILAGGVWALILILFEELVRHTLNGRW